MNSGKYTQTGRQHCIPECGWHLCMLAGDGAAVCTSRVESGHAQAWVGSPAPQRGVTRVDTVSEKAGTITTRVCSAHKPHAWGLQGHSSRATALPCSGPQCPGNIWGIGSLLDRSAYVEPARTWRQEGGRWFWAPPRGTPRGGGRTGHRFDWTVVPGQPVWPGLVHLRGPALTPGMPGRPIAVTLQ